MLPENAENLQAVGNYRTEKYKRGSRGISVELMESLEQPCPVVSSD